MDRAAFFAALRKRDNSLFGTRLSQGQVEGIEAILDAFATHGDGNVRTLAYGLATAYTEVTRKMQPVREHFAKTDAEAIRSLDKWAREKGRTTGIYWRPDPETGLAYFGRGFVQLTWKDNYRESSADAGIDLVENPDAMFDPVISARILWRGLIDGRWNGHGKGVGYYLHRDPPDVVQARRTVNILDRAEEVAGYYEQFLAAIEAAGGWTDPAPTQSPHPRPRPDTGWPDFAQPAPSGAKGLAAGIAAVLAAAGLAISTALCRVPFLSDLISSCGG